MMLLSSLICHSNPTLSLIFSQMLFKVPYDGAVDYFALGILLFDLAFNRFAFPESLTGVRGIKYGVPRYPKGADPDVKDLLEKVRSDSPSGTGKVDI